MTDLEIESKNAKKMASTNSTSLPEEPSFGLKEEELAMMKECVSKLTDGERTALLEEFRLFDKDKSGFITRKELSSVLRDLGVYKTTEAEEYGVEAMFNMFDKSQDNRIDENEFLGMMAISMKLPMSTDQLTDAFHAFDADGDGTVDSHELKSALGNLGPKFLSDEECDELMTLVDLNGDGLLSIEEFVNFFNCGDLGAKDGTKDATKDGWKKKDTETTATKDTDTTTTTTKVTPAQ